MCCLQVLKHTAGAADSGRVQIRGGGSLIFFVYADSGVGLLYLDSLSSLTQILPYVQVNIRSLAQRWQFRLLSWPPPRNDKLEMLKSWVWVLHLKKNFGESYVQRIIATSRHAISPGLGLSSSINYILYAQGDLITYKNIDWLPVFKYRYININTQLADLICHV